MASQVSIGAASTQSTTVATVAASTFPLYKDVLQVVFQYLHLSELPGVSHLSKHFHASLASMKPLCFSLANFNSSRLEEVPPHSAVASHVTNVQWDYAPLLPTAPQTTLLAIGNTFPHLKYDLYFPDVLTFEDQSDSPIVLPVSLQKFFADVEASFLTTTLMSRISELSSLHTLYLHIEFRGNAGLEVDYSPLQALRNLNQFQLHVDFREEDDEESEAVPHVDLDLMLPPSLYKFICASPSLTNLSVHGPWRSPLETHTEMIKKFLVELTRNHQAPQLKVLQFNQNIVLNQELLELLTAIPSLTELGHAPDIPNASYGILTRFPNLKSLKLTSGKNTLSIEGILLAARSCPNLISLEVTSKFSKSHREYLHSIIPQLKYTGALID